MTFMTFQISSPALFKFNFNVNVDRKTTTIMHIKTDSQVTTTSHIRVMRLRYIMRYVMTLIYIDI